VNKAAVSAAPLAKCILLHAYLHIQQLALSRASTNKNFMQLFNKLAK